MKNTFNMIIYDENDDFNIYIYIQGKNKLKNVLGGFMHTSLLIIC